jgi:hypothetical protein
MNIDLFKTDLLAAVKAAIEEDSSRLDTFANADDEFDDLQHDDELSELAFKQVHYDSQGDGNEMISVVAFSLRGHLLGYLRFHGMYSSWSDSEWHADDIEQVVPKRVVTTAYLNIDGRDTENYDEILGD